MDQADAHLLARRGSAGLGRELVSFKGLASLIGLAEEYAQEEKYGAD